MPRAAPRIDDRLVRFIHDAVAGSSAAELTRAVGALAWELDLPRPSYEQVRVLAREAPPPAEPTSGLTIDGVIGALYEYPAPLLGDWYQRYRRGGG